MDNMSHIWTPLGGPWKIRLLVVEPNTDHYATPICKLVTVSLNQHRRYYAISHAWGDPDDFKPIMIEGTRRPIMTSLQTCLRHLRDPNEETVLWVDALCVNQFDNDERSSQVKLMQYIFSNAVKVYIWLGTEPEEIDQAFQIIKQIGSGTEPDDVRINNERFDVKHTRSLTTFTTNEWWRRLWVRQEVALARDAVFVQGRSMLEMDHLMNFADFTQNETSGVTFSTRYRQFTPTSVAEMRDLNLFLDYILEIRSLHRLMDVVTSMSPKDRGERLIRVLHDSRHTRVTDIKDRIYGFLGLCTALFGDDFLDTTYGSTATEIYTRFAFKLIQASQSLSLLHQASSTYNSLTELPSWVPDWSSKYNFQSENMRWKYLGKFNATPGHTVSKVELRDNVLILQGFTADRVVVIGDICESTNNEHLRLRKPPHERIRMYNTIKSWEELHKKYLNRKSSTIRYDPEAFWRVLFLNTISGRLCEDGDREAFQKVMTWLKGETDNYEAAAVRSLYRGVCKRRFIITERGRIGTGPAETRPGDRISILIGGDVPLVLRPNSRSFDLPTYKYIGESYVHDIMEGEAMEEAEHPRVRDILLG